MSCPVILAGICTFYSKLTRFGRPLYVCNKLISIMSSISSFLGLFVVLVSLLSNDRKFTDAAKS